MEEWRRFPLVQLEQRELERYLAPAFPGRRLKSAALLTEGLCNTNYRIELEGLVDTFVLRLYVQNAKSCTIDRDIHDLIQNDVPVSEVVYTDPNRESFAYAYNVMRFDSGRTMKELLKTEPHATDAMARAAGNVLAELDWFPFPRAGMFETGLEVTPWEWESKDDDLCSTYVLKSLKVPQVSARLGEPRRERIEAFVADNRHYMGEISHRATLVHGDFQRGNLLLMPKGSGWEVSAVIDWDWAHAGSLMMDVGNMLRDASHLTPDFESSFIQGFIENGGSLPSHWKKISMYADMTSHLEFLGAKGDGDPLIPACLRYIDLTMDRWDTF